MTVISARPALKFRELFANAASRSEVVVTFLALLELIRLRQLVAMQNESFGEIEICRGSGSSPSSSSQAAPEAVVPGAANPSPNAPPAPA